MRPGWGRDLGTKGLAGTSKIILQREKKNRKKAQKGWEGTALLASSVETGRSWESA